MNKKVYYIYVRNVGIITRIYDAHETAQDIFCSLLGEFDMDIIGYDTELINVQRLFLDSILYETYKL